MEEIHLLFTQTASPIFLNALDNLLAARSNSRPRSVYRPSASEPMCNLLTYKLMWEGSFPL